MKIIISMLIVLLLSSCSSDNSSSSVDAQVPKVAKVVIAPSTVLLTDPDQYKTLEAVAYDTNGNVLNKKITWKSSHSDVVAITPDGNASAQGVIGSTTITAIADGVKSAQIMVLVTELVGGAIIVNDTQVVGDIEAVNPDDLPGLGYQYTVRLQNIPTLTIGDIIIGTGVVPIAGQVINIETNNTLTTVTIEVVPIDQVFSQLEINEDFDLSNVEAQVDKSLIPYYDMQKQNDGSYLWTLKDQAPTLSSQLYPSSSRNLGPIECSYDGSGVFPLTLSLPATYQLSHNLHTALDFSMGIGHLKAFVYGDLGTEFKIAPTFTTAVTAKVSCELKLATLPIPIGGAISYFFGLEVPLGVGLEAGGTLELAQLSFEAVSKTVYDVAFGLDCSSGTCIGLNQMQNRTSTFETKWVLPSGNINNDLRLKPEVSGFGFAKLEFDAIGLENSIELVGAKGGLSQGADLALIPAQCVDNNYTSDYKLSLFISVASGSDINEFISLFAPGSFSGFEYKVSTDLATSPKVIKATANKEQYHIADSVKFTVELDPNTINYGLLGYNVKKISIYKRIPDGQGGYNYSWFFDMPAIDGQTKFEREWLFTEEGTIKDSFYAFVDTFWLPTFGDFGILELASITTPSPIIRAEMYVNGTLELIMTLNYTNDSLLSTQQTTYLSTGDTDTTTYTYDAMGNLLSYTLVSSEPNSNTEYHQIYLDQNGRTIKDERYVDNDLKGYRTTQYNFDSNNTLLSTYENSYFCHETTSCLLDQTTYIINNYNTDGRIDSYDVNYDFYRYDEDGELQSVDHQSDHEVCVYVDDQLTEIHYGEYLWKYFY